MVQDDDSSIPIKSSKQFEDFFNIQLNRTYCAKSHLYERLQEIVDHIHFEDLILAIVKTTADVEKQIKRMDLIFKMLQTEPGFENCQGTISIMEEAFNAIQIHSNSSELRDLSIIFYLQCIENIEITSFNMLLLAAPRLHRLKIQELLKESYNEAKEDRALFEHLTSTYFKFN